MSTSELIQTMVEYKAWSNQLLFPKLLSEPAIKESDDYKQIIGTLNHVYVVDCIFQAHLLEVPHTFTAANTPVYPALEDLFESVRIMDSWYVKCARNLTDAELLLKVHFTFTNGEEACMSKSDIFFHIVNPGTYHRGNVAVLMQQNHLVPDRDLVTHFLNDRKQGGPS